jgi:hypothetical protein
LLRQLAQWVGDGIGQSGLLGQDLFLQTAHLGFFGRFVS